MGFLPQSVRGWIGTSMVSIGLAMGVYGATQLGKNIEFWSDKYKDHVTSVVPGYDGPTYTQDEAQACAKATKHGLIAAFGGIASIGVGLVVGATRENRPGSPTRQPRPLLRSVVHLFHGPSHSHNGDLRLPTPPVAAISAPERIFAMRYSSHSLARRPDCPRLWLRTGPTFLCRAQ